LLEKGFARSTLVCLYSLAAELMKEKHQVILKKRLSLGLTLPWVRQRRNCLYNIQSWLWDNVAQSMFFFSLFRPSF